MITPPTVNEADVRLAASGDRSAYERLVRRCAGLVTAVALSVVRDVERSEDIAQEVFVAAWKDLSKLRNPHTFLPWLRNMTRHLSLRTLRDRHVPTDGTVLAGVADERASVAEQLEGSERTRVLEAALMELEADDREVLLVYYREGKSLRQVASLLDLSEPAARKRLSRARARLRDGVEQRLGELAVETAPDESRLALNVLALLPTTLSSGASVATAVKAATSGGTFAMFGPPLIMLLVLLGGMSFSLKKLQARARNDEEREGLRRYALISGTAASFAVLGMCFGTVFEWPYPVFMVIWGAYVALWDALVLVYLPRVMARRLALERAEDPAAEARQRRDRRKVFAMVGYATFCTLLNLGLSVYAMWRG
jgi:RNA polymerase sigma factor (sigma-70 family)